ncbi:hypothetical protein Tco_1547979 [Tanacetum coccineum]
MAEHEAKRQKIVNSSKEATMWITRANDPLNSKGKSNDLLLQSLRPKFEWVITQARALGIPPPLDKKRKRSSEILEEVFVKENIVVDGMHRNLVPPSGIEGRQGLVIREHESGIFFYNGNWDLVFQREEEFHLATTAQLIRL